MKKVLIIILTVISFSTFAQKSILTKLSSGDFGKADILHGLVVRTGPVLAYIIDNITYVDTLQIPSGGSPAYIIGRGLGLSDSTLFVDTTQHLNWLYNSLGTTTNSAIKISNNTAAVSGTPQVSPALRFTANGYSTTTASSQPYHVRQFLNMGASAAIPQPTFTWQDSGYGIGTWNTFMAYDLKNSYFGIGTATPAYLLHIKSSGSAYATIESGAHAVLQIIRSGYSNYADVDFYTGTDASKTRNFLLSLDPTDTTLRLANNGGLGVKVNVTGNAIFTGGIRNNVVSKTTGYGIAATDQTILGDATSAAFTLTLPTAINKLGQEYLIKKTDASANAVTVGTTSSQTIDGSTTYSLSAQYKYVRVQSNGLNWNIIGNN